VTELSPIGLLVVQGLLKLLWGDALLLEEELADPDGPLGRWRRSAIRGSQLTMFDDR
jgi:hypothetical protein